MLLNGRPDRRVRTAKVSPDPLAPYCSSLSFPDIGQLRLEISALEELSRQLFLEVHSLRNMQERQRWATTLQGKYFNVLGHFFSVYCMWKIFISTINIVFDRVGKKDMVTRGLEIAVHWCGLEMDVAFWSQHVSFILVGCIVVTSIRGLLLTLTKVTRWSRCDRQFVHSIKIFSFACLQFFYKISSSKSSNIIVLVLAQIMGMYFCSSVLLMRMNMPSEYRVIITEVLGGLHFNFYHRWFDVIFLVSAITTIVVLYLLHKPPHSDAMDNWCTTTTYTFADTIPMLRPEKAKKFVPECCVHMSVFFSVDQLLLVS